MTESLGTITRIVSVLSGYIRPWRFRLGEVLQMSAVQYSLRSASAPMPELPLASAAVRSVEWSGRWWPLSPVMVDAVMVTIVSLAATVNAFLSGRHANHPIWIVAFGGVTFLVLRGSISSRLCLIVSMLVQRDEVLT